MYNRAKTDWGWTGTNPADRVRAFKEKPRARFMDGDELPAFFKSLAIEPNRVIRDFFLIALLTGARRSNVQAMAWPQINWNRATWTVPAEQSKNGEELGIVLVPMAMRILETRNASTKSEFVFPGVGKTGHLVEPKSAWRRILKRADIGDLRLHDLRRTLGSWQAATGASLQVIGKSLGHESLESTKVYSRLKLDSVRESVEKATNAMMLAGNVAGLLRE
jgi:integrase